MPIIQTVNRHDFYDAFDIMHREAQMGGAAGCDALFGYLDEAYSEETWELDVIALCCDWTQYDDLDEMLKDYGAEDLEELGYDKTVIRYTETEYTKDGVRLEFEKYIIQSY